MRNKCGFRVCFFVIEKFYVYKIVQRFLLEKFGAYRKKCRVSTPKLGRNIVLLRRKGYIEKKCYLLPLSLWKLRVETMSFSVYTLGVHIKEEKRYFLG